MAARSTGWAMLFANSVQEVMDFALISQANGKYACAENTGAAPLNATRTTVGLWETFHWELSP